MTHWTFEDTLKYLLVGVVSVSFVLIDGPALARRLHLRAGSFEAAVTLDPEEAAHQQALSFEQQYPMVDVLGYGHGESAGLPITFVLFGIVDPAAIEAREPEVALALMQLTGRLAEEASQALVVVHFSFAQGVLTGELNCPNSDYASYDEMEQGGCQAALYPPDVPMPLPKSLANWEGVGK